MYTNVELIKRQQCCVVVTCSDSLQVKDGHRQDGWVVRAVSMVSSGTLEGTDWKIDFHKLRLTLSAVVPAAFYKQLLSQSARPFLILSFFFPT